MLQPVKKMTREESCRADWLEWATYNLALGVPEPDVRAEMLKNGFACDELDVIVAGISRRSEYKAAQQLARKYKLACDLNEALLEMAAQTFDFSQIKRVSNLSSTDFLSQYYAVNRPVIITDVVSRWPAMSKWTLGFFRRQFGSQPISFQNGRSADDHRDCFVDHTVRATFEEFLDAIEGVPPDASPPYLIAHDRLLDRAAFRPLLDDLVFDPRYFNQHYTSGQVFFWLGAGRSASPMHRDLVNVYMAQVIGRKLIRMVPSTQMHLMYNEAGYHSEADFNDVSVEKYSLLKHADIMEFVLEPGEMLFIPVGWWHFVKSLETTVTITGNNFCFRNALRPIF